MKPMFMESEECYHSIIAEQSELICRFLPDRSLTFVNEAFCRYFGKKRDELIGRNFIDEIIRRSFLSFILSDDRRQIEDRINGLSLENRFAKCEHRVLAKNDKICWIQWNLTAVIKENDNLIAFQAVGRDTTERKQGEEELQRSEEKYRSLVSNMPDVLWTTDDQMRIVFVSDNVLEVCGYTPEEAYRMGQWENWYDRVHPADIESARAAFVALINGGKRYDVEYRFKRNDGKWIWLHDRAVTTYEKDGVRYVDGLMSDVTERRQAQETKWRIMQRALFNSRLASVGKMASGIAHEIKNPLFSVVGLTELILESDLNKDIRENIEIIHDAARRASSIVDRLLTFARQHKAERKYVDINEIIVTTLALRAHELATNNIEVGTHLASKLPKTLCDGDQLQQVFLNIVLNAEAAIRSVRKSGSLKIKTEAKGNIICISFIDDGPGIAKNNLEKVFDPFFTTKETGEGTGLGLSICHGIISEHNGRIYAKSQLNKGATFAIELPILVKSDNTT